MDHQTYKAYFEPVIPSVPGIYKFIDQENRLLYVGKAKNLKKRVASYFTSGRNHSSRIKLLVKKSSTIEYTIVESEHDALLLENNLIKKHQPKYNVLLKDGKTFPFICIKNEPFPRVFLTRTRTEEGSEYLGPYTSVTRVKTILEFVNILYPLRTCNYNLSQANIRSGKFSLCLEYHIGNCLGPCVGLQTETDYAEGIRDIRHILGGHISRVGKHLSNKMKKHAEKLEFEQAENTKKKLDHLKNFQSKSTIVNPRIKHVDVFALEDTVPAAYVAYFKVVNGTIVQTNTVQLSKKLNESPEELLQYTIAVLREKYNSRSKEIIVPFHVQYPEENIKLTIPQRGDKLKLLSLARKNALQYKNHVLTKLDKYKSRKSPSRILEQLKIDLRMNVIPAHIECFDNSNIQGANPVASMVVFKNGKPLKKEYRHFNIKSVSGPNDFASMEEIVMRRYKRLIDEKKPLPSLILIDGGKGQLSAAIKSIDSLGLRGRMTVASIAKKLEEIYLPGDPLALHINKKSESLRLLQKIRDEAHRFAITFHRSKRDKSTLHTELTKIDGIGKTTAEKLLIHFRSTKKIKDADQATLEKVIGKSKTQLILSHFHK